MKRLAAGLLALTLAGAPVTVLARGGGAGGGHSAPSSSGSRGSSSRPVARSVTTTTRTTTTTSRYTGDSHTVTTTTTHMTTHYAMNPYGHVVVVRSYPYSGWGYGSYHPFYGYYGCLYCFTGDYAYAPYPVMGTAPTWLLWLTILLLLGLVVVAVMSTPVRGGYWGFYEMSLLDRLLRRRPPVPVTPASSVVPVPPLPVSPHPHLTTDRTDPGLHRTGPDGMNEKYLILSDEERHRGFVRPLRHRYKHLKCGGVTGMGERLCETYARDPKFYGATFCAVCGGHFDLLDDKGRRTFVWDEDGEGVGS